MNMEHINFHIVVTLLVNAVPCISQEELHMLSYTRLPSYPDPTHPFPVYKLHGGTALDSAYDTNNSMLYVLGDGSHVLHIIDFSDPGNPRLVMDHIFKMAEGRPLSVDVCGGELTVVMTSPLDEYEGHVKIYRCYTHTEKQLTYLQSIPVGFHPNHVAYSKDCGTMIVTNQGVATLDVRGRWVDPRGSVSVFKKGHSSTWVKTDVDFTQFNGRTDIRQPSQCASAPSPLNASTLAQDLAPVYSAISQDGHTAYVSLQENNAIAQISLARDEVKHIFNLGVKNWNLSRLDASDKDGGAKLATYPIYGLYQPRVFRVMEVDRKTYLVTANEGKVRHYTKAKHGVTWSDAVRTGQLSPLHISNTSLLGQVKDDTQLGRLMVSQCDGVGSSGGVENLHAFGGRGFSIWDTSHMTHPVYDSWNDVEEVNKLLLDNIFNTDVLTTSQLESPESLMDTQSDEFGPQITALDILEDRGQTYMVMGSGTMGSVYLYTINPLDLNPDLNHVLHEGGTKHPLQDMYNQGTAGNMGISDIRIVSSSDNPTNRTLVIVVSNMSGSVAIYRIDKETV